MEVHGGAQIHLQPLKEPAVNQVDAQRRLWSQGKPVLEQGLVRICGCMERGAHTWSSCFSRICGPRGDPRWSSLSLKESTLWKGPTMEQLVKNCRLWEGLTLNKLVQDNLPWEEPHTGTEQGYEEFCPWGGRSSNKMWWSDSSPIPLCLSDESRREIEWRWAQEEGSG